MKIECSSCGRSLAGYLFLKKKKRQIGSPDECKNCRRGIFFDISPSGRKGKVWREFLLALKTKREIKRSHLEWYGDDEVSVLI